MPNGASSGPASGGAGNTGANFLPNNGRVIQNGGARILCIADVRGKQISIVDLGTAEH